MECLRGFAALVVMVAHIFHHDTDFDTRYCPAIFKSLVPNAHLEVLIFFILSGFVIGLNHPEHMNRAEIGSYAKKRFLRIYPIYFIAMIIALIASKQQYDNASIVSNFTLTQNIWRAPFWPGSPAWSINYEMLYYLLFIPISFFRIGPMVAFVISLLLGTINLYLPVNPIFTGYFIGFCFWLSGLMIVRSFSGNIQIKILPFLFYILALPQLIGNFTIMPLLRRILPPLVKTAIWPQIIVNTDDLVSLPFCFMIVLYFSGRAFKGRNLVFAALSIFPLYQIVKGLVHHNRDWIFIVGTVYFLLFLLFLKFPVFNGQVKTILAKLGGISYALYLLHFSLICILGKLTFVNAPVANYMIKILLLFFSVFGLSWILEKRFQPLIKKLFARRRYELQPNQG